MVGLGEDLQGFGHDEGHCDRRDLLAGITAMICISDMPKTYQGGRFHFLVWSAYVLLERNIVVSFCGLQKHGGTPPLAPPGVEPHPSAIRGTIVLYPPEHSMLSSGDVIMPMCTLPNGSLLSVTPEMLCFEPDAHERKQSEQAAFLVDGSVLHDDTTLFNQFARTQLYVADYLRKQLPPHLRSKIRIDPKAFLQSFMLVDGDDNNAGSNPLHPDPWPGAPRQIDQDAEGVVENWSAEVPQEDGCSKTREFLTLFQALEQGIKGMSDASTHRLRNELWKDYGYFREQLLLLPGGKGSSKKRKTPPGHGSEDELGDEICAKKGDYLYYII